MYATHISKEIIFWKVQLVKRKNKQNFKNHAYLAL